jgi:hypothetical protein
MIAGTLLECSRGGTGYVPGPMAAAYDRCMAEAKAAGYVIIAPDHRN